MVTLHTTVAEAIQRAREGQRTTLTCPAHDDINPSLSIGPGDSQPIVFHCHAGCETERILDAVGMDWADVSNEDWEPADRAALWTPVGYASDVYPYHLHDGTLSFQVLRVPTPNGKRFMQRAPEPDGTWRWRLDDAVRVPYRLPQLIEAAQGGHTIHVAEGEKCVHALLAALPEGDAATCNPGGAGKFRPEYGHWFAGANVIVYADSDEPGRQHARDVHEVLLGHGCTVKIVEAPPGLMKSGKRIGDVADHLDAGLSLDRLLETTPESSEQKARTAVDVLEIVNRPPKPFDYVIEGTLARAERLLIVGPEGRGKSLVCFQMAVCTAAGIHPFTLTTMEPKRVLVIDAENHPNQVLHSWRRLVRCTDMLGAPLAPGMLHVLEEWDSEIDLISPRGSRWLEERVYAYRPDLLVLGPLKNLVHRNLSDHDTVNALRMTINRARIVCESAVIMEHHAPLRAGGDQRREMRPYGSGLFLGWPDFGLALEHTDEEEVFEISRFRGDRVRGRYWPSALRWGSINPGSTELPWMETIV